MPSVDASWIRGKHTVTLGGSFSYTQLNARDQRTNTGMIRFTNFAHFLQGLPSYTADGFITTHFLQGDANRYYRSNETGGYLQDKYQIRPNLSFTAGVRFDYHGGLTEKNGRIFNFDPSQYTYDAASDIITSNGFILRVTIHSFPRRASVIRRSRDGNGASRRAWALPGARGSSTTSSSSVPAGGCITIAANCSLTFPRVCGWGDHGRAVWGEPNSPVGKFAVLRSSSFWVRSRLWLRKPLGNHSRAAAIG